MDDRLFREATSCRGAYWERMVRKMAEGHQPSQPLVTADWRGSRGRPAPARKKRQPDADDSRRRTLLHWAGRGGFVLVLVTLLLIFVDFLLRLSPTTPFLFLGIADYAPPWVPNAMIGEDHGRFEESWEGRGTSLRLLGGVGDWDSPAAFKTEISRQFTALQPTWLQQRVFRWIHRPVVLIYIRALGQLNAQGEPSLILATPHDWEAEDWSPQVEKWQLLPLGELLEHVAAVRPSGWKVVMLLDCNQQRSHWPAGLYDNGFAERLPEAARQADLSDMVIISAAGPGQVSWALPERKGSVFGYAVWRGLQGAADREGSGDGDGTISLAEFSSFVRSEVRKLARDHRGALQEPQIWPEQAVLDDLALAAAPVVRATSPESDLAETDAVGQEQGGEQRLHEFWQFHDTGRQMLEQRAPRPNWLLSYHAFQQGLLRLEQLEDAGRAYRQERDRLSADLGRLKAGLRQNSEPEFRFGHSLPMTVRGSVSGVPNRTLPASEDDADIPRCYTARAVEVWHRLLQAESLDIAESLQAYGEPVPDPELVEFRALRQLRSEGHLPQRLRGDTDLLRLALVCRDQAERAAAVPSDLRVLAFARPWVEQGDASRRRAEDALFAGQTGVAEGFEAAQQAYDRAQQLESTLAEAYRVRDQSWAQVLHFAQWAEQSPAAETCRALCEDLVLKTAKLARRLGDLPPPSRQVGRQEAVLVAEDRVHEIVSFAEQVQERLLDLSDQHREETRTAIRERDRLAAARLLATPLVTAGHRRQLRALLRSPPSPSVDYSDLPATGFSGSDTRQLPLPVIVLETLEEAVAMPNREADVAAAVSETDRKQWLDRLVRLGSATSDQLARVAQAVAEFDPVAGSWSQGEETEQRVRRAATLLNLPPAYVDPQSRRGRAVNALWWQYEGHLYCWQAERVLEDFLGNEGADEERAPAYFERVASRYLHAADQCQPGEALGSRILELRGQLETRRQAAQRWAAWKVGQVDKVIDAQQEISGTTTIRWHEALPEGVAVVRATAPDAGRVEFRFQQPDGDQRDAGPAFDCSVPVEVPAVPQERYTFQLRPRSAFDDHTLWELSTYFRGHFSATDFPVRVGQRERVVQSSRPRYGPPRIQVFREQREGRWDGRVAFVLDCSESMKIEQRLKYAQMALGAMLRDLQETERFQIAVWLFGHRRGFAQDGPELAWNRAEIDGQAVFPEDPAITHDSDVQMLTPDQFQTYLGHEAIRAMGRTPLRRAMLDALTWLEQGNPEIPRKLVVLTDGAATDSKLTNADVARAFRNASGTDPKHRIMLTYIIDDGPDLPHLMKMAQELADQFGERVGRRPGEGYVTLTPHLEDRDQLLRDMNTALGVYRYQVFESASETRLSDPQRLGESCEIRLRSTNGPVPCEIRLTSQSTLPFRPPEWVPDEWLAKADVALEGGEALLLRVREERLEERHEGRLTGEWEVRRHLVHQPYEAEVAARARLTLPEVAKAGAPPVGPDLRPRSFFVAVHPAVPSPEGTQFRISLQNADPERFSPRPREIWLEIRPGTTAGGGSVVWGEPYVFLEPLFEPGMPVPVLRFHAPQWPLDANQAQLRLWLNWDQTPALQTLVIQDGLGRRAELQDSVLTFRLNSHPQHPGGSQIVVDEQYPDASQGSALRLRMIEIPDSVTRHYYPNVGLIRHFFCYQAVPASEARAFRIEATARTAIQELAIPLPEPLQIPVSTTP